MFITRFLPLLSLFCLLSVKSFPSYPRASFNSIRLFRRNQPPLIDSWEFVRFVSSLKSKDDAVFALISLLKYIQTNPNATLYVWQYDFLIHYQNPGSLPSFASTMLYSPQYFQESLSFGQFDFQMYSTYAIEHGFTLPQSSSEVATFVSDILSQSVDQGVLLPSWIDWNSFIRRWIRDYTHKKTAMLKMQILKFLKQLKIQLTDVNVSWQRYGKLKVWQILILHAIDYDNQYNTNIVGLVLQSILPALNGNGPLNSYVSTTNGQTILQLVGQNFFDALPQSQELSNFISTSTMTQLAQYPQYIDAVIEAISPQVAIPIMNLVDTDFGVKLMYEVFLYLWGLGFSEAWVFPEEALSGLIAELKIAFGRDSAKVQLWQAIAAQILTDSNLTDQQQNQYLVSLVNLIFTFGNDTSLSTIVHGSQFGQNVLTSFAPLASTINNQIEELQSQMLNQDSLFQTNIQYQHDSLTQFEQYLQNNALPQFSQLDDFISTLYDDTQPHQDEYDSEEFGLQDENIFLTMDQIASSSGSVSASNETAPEENHCVATFDDWNQASQEIQNPQDSPDEIPGLSAASAAAAVAGLFISFSFNKGNNHRGPFKREVSDTVQGSIGIALSKSNGTLVVSSDAFVFNYTQQFVSNCLNQRNYCGQINSSRQLATQVVSPIDYQITIPEFTESMSSFILSQCIWLQFKNNASAVLTDSAESATVQASPNVNETSSNQPSDLKKLALKSAGTFGTVNVVDTGLAAAGMVALSTVNPAGAVLDIMRHAIKASYAVVRDLFGRQSSLGRGRHLSEVSASLSMYLQSNDYSNQTWLYDISDSSYQSLLLNFSRTCSQYILGTTQYQNANISSFNASVVSISPMNITEAYACIYCLAQQFNNTDPLARVDAANSTNFDPSVSSPSITQTPDLSNIKLQFVTKKYENPYCFYLAKLYIDLSNEMNYLGYGYPNQPCIAQLPNTVTSTYNLIFNAPAGSLNGTLKLDNNFTLGLYQNLDSKDLILPEVPNTQFVVFTNEFIVSDQYQNVKSSFEIKGLEDLSSLRYGLNNFGERIYFVNIDNLCYNTGNETDSSEKCQGNYFDEEWFGFSDQNNYTRKFDASKWIVNINTFFPDAFTSEPAQVADINECESYCQDICDAFYYIEGKCYLSNGQNPDKFSNAYADQHNSFVKKQFESLLQNRSQ